MINTEITLACFLAILSRALTHTENPAIVRLPELERTVWGLVGAYLPRCVFVSAPPLAGPVPVTEVIGLNAVMVERRLHWTLDLTDPGTAHALLVALALALGLDPGVGGLEVKWGRMMDARTVFGSDANPRYMDYALFSPSLLRSEMLCGRQYLAAPIVAAESDAIKALALAALHVLERP